MSSCPPRNIGGSLRFMKHHLVVWGEKWCPSSTATESTEGLVGELDADGTPAPTTGSSHSTGPSPRNPSSSESPSHRSSALPPSPDDTASFLAPPTFPSGPPTSSRYVVEKNTSGDSSSWVRPRVYPAQRDESYKTVHGRCVSSPTLSNRNNNDFQDFHPSYASSARSPDNRSDFHSSPWPMDQDPRSVFADSSSEMTSSIYPCGDHSARIGGSLHVPQHVHGNNETRAAPLVPSSGTAKPLRPQSHAASHHRGGRYNWSEGQIPGLDHGTASEAVCPNPYDQSLQFNGTPPWTVSQRLPEETFLTQTSGHLRGSVPLASAEACPCGCRHDGTDPRPCHCHDIPYYDYSSLQPTESSADSRSQSLGLFSSV